MVALVHSGSTAFCSPLIAEKVLVKSHKVRIKDSIATKLLTVVFSIYFLVTLTVTAIHMTAEYYNTEAGVKSDLLTFQKTFEQGIATEVWNVDEDALHSILRGIVQVPIIVGVQIKDGDGEDAGAAGVVVTEDQQVIKIDSQGNRTSISEEDLFSELIPHDFDIIYHTEDNEAYTVGHGTLYSSSDVVLNKVQYGFIFILVNSVIKTLALWFIFLYVGRRLLGNPLGQLALAAESLDLETAEHVKIQTGATGKTELKMLEYAFNHMTQKLATSRRALQDSFRQLEEAKHRLELLLEATREMAKVGVVQFSVFEKALDAIVQFIPLTPTTVVKMYYREKIQNTYGYAYFEIPVVRDSRGVPIIQMHVLGVKHSFHRENPLNSRLDKIARETQMFEDTLSIFCWDGDILLGLVDIENIQNEHFTVENKEFIDTLCQSLTISLKNIEANSEVAEKIRMDREMKVAAAVQTALLPKSLPQVPKLELSSFYQSASETGGDWYGFMTQFKNQLYILIGDVTGHGTPAALVTAAASATSRIIEEMYFLSYTINQELPSPADCLHYFNTAVYEAGHPDFLMTFFLARIDLQTGKMTFSNAGHNFPILIRQDDKIRRLLNGNIRLGDNLDWEFTESTLYLKKGDMICFYTDGLIENTNAKGQEWGIRNLTRFLRTNTHHTANEIVAGLTDEAYRFYGGHTINDDITIVTCKIVESFGEG